MKTQAAVVQTVQDFCRAWFEKRDADKALAFFHEDINFVRSRANAARRQRKSHHGYTEGHVRGSSPQELLCPDCVQMYCNG